MDFRLDDGWLIRPLGGNTGTAYMGVKEQKKLFIKRNTSPFLAALSLEEITPRLLWAKHISTGDTLTAQEWLNGRSLTREEMKETRVAKLLARVHHSGVLSKMLQQVGGRYIFPGELLNDYFRGLSSELRQHPLLREVAARLRAHPPKLDYHECEVCHGDLNHKNWLLSDSNQLYLVDWESAALSDAALDISMLMCQYVPRSEWQEWLVKKYGAQMTPTFNRKIGWYCKINLLLSIKDKHQRGHFFEMNQDILQLAEIFSEQRD
ncbi:phosphotransferase family protein [Liquorilactobacillus satsumensis]|uniref:Phosphotransferase family protein n=1 Tax=Liquorilactobacillus satsumensis DSM 16230 = JCM 12392 TaxID=1423801 RepID=A0A0R1V2T4_9LACO|nr:phosphotransferase family protein [Liquorilactobacillus satsumensis]KRL99822.1 phosphotransferase family protein [Liquorilactobacillus satsumensis DSM 16230 = JCM 12392]MCC7665688.1 phosphotransferase [Liquorilactobacillus satsumensis]MCP9311900.1 phosphotransferase family protein [Liquorilactobacillus satsumensis]MCP9328300.1 phosphotransferase family protein [Liquorilactobacillus satsumensis]MCP9356519.1 phosphotransferase family protein [Liquorilactobacillus satsumensis]